MPPAGGWKGVNETPKDGARIEFEMSGRSFRGVFHGASQPWETAWRITYGFNRNKPVACNNISRWRYR